MQPYYEADGISVYLGDSREILVGLDAEPTLVFTDPPYGINYLPMREGHRRIANDASLEGAARLTAEVLTMTAGAEAHFVCCDWRSLPSMTTAMETAGLTPKSCIVWDKMRPVQNLDRFAKQYELVLYAGPFGGRPTRRTDVWRVDRDHDREADHPTPKPVRLVQMALAAAGSKTSLVLDPFMGSGSTLLAAQAMGCRAIGIEVEEQYCEAAARRLSAGVEVERMSFADWGDAYHPRKGEAVASLFEV